ncbi:MAG: acetate kinase [Planctomycetes bacterium]|nr:acetate kinase [Planctomycetota bacterium]
MDILVINSGSSSLKYLLFDMGNEGVLAKGIVEKIGEETSFLKHSAGENEITREAKAPDHDAAFDLMIQALLDKGHGVIQSTDDVSAVGHRVVHGGETFVESTVITDEVKQTIEDYFPLAPLHNPPNLAGIRAAQKAFPSVPHVAVFDTAFHQTMPKRAYMYALPYELYEEDRIRKYGFHGTSHRFVSMRAAEILGIPRGEFNCITCHLGNGCSLTAVRDGKSVDTSMGLTPLEGVVMGTRTGDFDPAIVFYLARRRGYSLDEMDKLFNKQSGLLGLSGVSNDMREIHEAAEGGNERARLAIDVFAYRVRKYIGAYMAVLGRTDAIVFTGGIGENACGVREAICTGLEPLGIVFDSGKNAATRVEEAIVSGADSRVTVMVVPTNEELLIARDTLAVAEKTAVKT